MGDESLEPKLRFSDEPWNSKKLGNICKITMGQSPSSSNYTENETDTVLIQGNADLINGKVVPRIYTTEVTKIANPGDIILTVRAPVGDLAINEFKSCIGRGVCSIEGNKFIYYFLQTLKDKHLWERFSQGSTFESINSNDIKNLNVKIPSEKTQKLISDFLTLIDNKISLLEKKYDNYQNFKKYLMQQIFAQKLRFDYEEYALKDVCEQIGNGFSGTQVPYKTSFPVTRIETISSGNINYDKVGFVDEIPERYLLKEGDILLTNINSMKWIGNSVYYDGQEKLYHGMNLMLLRTKNDFNSKYLYYYITYYNNWFKRMACQAVNQASINKSTLEKFIIKFPNIEEQNNISNVLSSSDMKIDQIINEIELTKKFKKGLLQQMFV